MHHQCLDSPLGNHSKRAVDALFSPGFQNDKLATNTVRLRCKVGRIGLGSRVAGIHQKPLCVPKTSSVLIW
jgi:hypothetical protein